MRTERRRAAAVGAQARLRPQDRDRPRRRDRGQPADAAWRAANRRAWSVAASASEHVPSCGIADEPPVDRRRQHQPRGRPGRLAGDAAAARGRLLGDRQRRHGRAPAPRAARSTAARARVLQKIAPPPSRHVSINAAVPATRSAQGLHAAAAAGRHLGRRDGRLPPARSTARPAPPSDNGQADQSWYVVLRARHRDQQADRGRGDRRAGRLRRRGRGARGPPDPVAVVLAVARPFMAGTSQDAVSVADPDSPPSSPRPSPRRRARCCGSTRCCCSRRSGWSACSLVTLKGATKTDIPGHPLFYVERQPVYARDRARARDACCSRLRLLAPARATSYGDLRPADRAQHPRARARPGRARLAPLDPAAVLPVPAVRVRQAAADPGAGGVRRRPLAAPARARHDRADHAAGAAAGAARDPPARPRHRHGLRGVAFSRPLRRRHVLEAAGRAGRAVRAWRWRSCSSARSGGRRARAQALPGAAPDGIPQPVPRPAKPDLPTSPSR